MFHISYLATPAFLLGVFAFLSFARKFICRLRKLLRELRGLIEELTAAHQTFLKLMLALKEGNLRLTEGQHAEEQMAKSSRQRSPRKTK